MARSGRTTPRRRPSATPIGTTVFSRARFGEVFFLLRGDERNSFARCAGTARAADPVNVVLGHVRQFIVEDVRQIIDVQPARRDIGGDEHLQLSFLECFERFHSRLLALVAVDGVDDEPVLLELRASREAPCFVRMKQDLRQVARPDEMLEESALASEAPCTRTALRYRPRVAFGDFDQVRRLSSWSASFLISPENVAENRRFWRFAVTGSKAMIR